jgi:hypothetical protein
MKSPDNSLDSRIETLLKEMSFQKKVSFFLAWTCGAPLPSGAWASLPW